MSRPRRNRHRYTLAGQVPAPGMRIVPAEDPSLLRQLYIQLAIIEHAIHRIRQALERRL